MVNDTCPYCNTKIIHKQPPKQRAPAKKQTTSNPNNSIWEQPIDWSRPVYPLYDHTFQINLINELGGTIIRKK